MLIPSIDLQGGRIVQLIQGEKLAVESTDVDGWIERFRRFPKVQLIDLDAAKDTGANDPLVQRICAELPCRVGGGIRTIGRAREVLSSGATAVIVGSSLFRQSRVDVAFARSLADTFGLDRVIAAVDSRGGRVVVNGWRTQLELTAIEAVAELEPFAGEFLYTHVDLEGLMKGTDIASIKAVRAATSRRVTAAGGITTQAEIAELDSAGIDAVVGMALYTGRLSLGMNPRAIPPV
jgi:phosphoribosylformimino-5-aminoimidazole carboxamide ribotide isomerase